MACGGDDDTPRVSPPSFDTSHALYGTAAAGRAIPISSLRVVEADALGDLAPEPVSGTDVDMLVAGLDASDLPDSLPPDSLRFVGANEADARPLPRLRDPHVFSAPAPFERPSALVPVDGPELSRDEREERSLRLDSLLSGLGIESPCEALASPLSVTTPRISADSIRVMRTLSSGDTVLGFSITSTVVFGLVRPGRTDVTLVPAPTVEPILEQGEVAELQWFSDDEVEVDGRRLPAAFTFDIAGGFGSAGVHMRWDQARRRYVEDTPNTPESAPRHLEGMIALELDGAPHTCGYGGAVGNERVATLWCRAETSTVWRAQISVAKAFSLTGVRPRASGAHLATDLAGSVYEYAGNGRWATVLETSLNAGCDPLCASFSSFAALPGDARLGIMGGGRAQLLLLEAGGAGVQARRPEALDRALFFDERPEAPDPLRFSAIERAPDGALWIADVRPSLFRYDPAADTVQRFCLPEALREVPIASIEAREDGALILGMSPALLAFGRWQ